MALARHRVPELMDEPGLDPQAHAQALRGLRRINRISRTAPALLRPLLRYVSNRPGAGLTILDVACGGGEVSVDLARLARDRGIRCSLTFFDQSPTALNEAAARAARANVESAGVLGDITQASPGLSCDVVINTLFLHHLDHDGVVATLRWMRDACAGVLLVSDLRRTRRGLLAAHLACLTLSRSPIVHFDGPASVRAAWTAAEMQSMAGDAGLANADVRRQWPQRMLLEWRRSG